ncbi:hypothetical protein M3Y96_00493800 [Aphelenchoides besseyi]|nr:hypothetical protein M3Y96_00493800 [Aphelenchoides besseyi]
MKFLVVFSFIVVLVAAGTSTPRTFAAFKSSVPTDNFSSVKTNSYGTQTSRYGTETTRYGTQTSRYGTQTPTPSYPTGTYTPSASQTTNKAFTCTNYNPSFYVDNVNYDTYTTSRYHKALVQNESNPDPYFYVPSVVFQTIVDKLNATKNGDVYVVKCDQASLVPYRALLFRVNGQYFVVGPEDYLDLGTQSTGTCEVLIDWIPVGYVDYIVPSVNKETICFIESLSTSTPGQVTSSGSTPSYRNNRTKRHLKAVANTDN